MKWFRDGNENPCGSPTVGEEGVDITDTDPVDIRRVKDIKGSNYEFDMTDSGLKHWSWRQMIKAFPVETQRTIIGGGLCSIRIAPLQGSYDHMRAKAALEHHWEVHPDARMPIWNFIARRIDNTEVRWRCDRDKKVVNLSEVAARDWATTPPANGCGRSDGPGTFKRYKNMYQNRQHCVKAKASAHGDAPSRVEAASSAHGDAQPNAATQ
jgi:hypothetical protein